MVIPFLIPSNVKFTYDTTRFSYLGYEDIAGLKVQKILEDPNSGVIRFISSSLGKDNSISADKSLIRLKFRAKAVGEGKVDVLKGRIADFITETDVLEANCGEKTIIVEGPKDVNRSGEYTLLDLAIDSYYYGMNAADTDNTKYDADQDLNGTISDADLSLIVDDILENVNYTPNI